MSDGRVEIDVEVDGKGVASLNNRLNQLTDAGGRAGISIKNLVVSMGLLKVASAAITASINAIKTSFSSAISEGAKFEQSIGGVKTLFGDNDWGIVSKNADQAFKTAGVSANKYMETVTSFSASLISSLGGDTKKAADLADVAVRDMSDNANKMGTDMELIMQTYQSLARGNYAMLDNLKLGYGGTKSEMERLMKDAEKITGEHYTVGDFADTVKAIHAVQDSLKITGTTAAEAATTMSGSFASMKAAMQNVLGKLAIGEDIKDELNDLATTTSTFLFGNFIPMVKRILQGLPELFSTFTKLAVDHLKKGLSELTGKDLSKPIDTVVEVASKAIKNVKEAIQSVMTVFSNVSGGPTAWVSTISKAFIALNSVITASANIVKKFMTALGETGAIQNVKNAIESVSNAFKKITDSVGDASIWSTLGTAIGNVISVIARGVQVVAEFMSKLDPRIIRVFTDVLVGTVVGFSAVKTGMKGLDFIQSFNPFNAFRKNVETGMTGAEKSISRSKSTIAQIFSGLSNIVKSSGNAIKASATGIGTGIKTALTGVATAAKGIGAGLATTFKSIGQAIRLAGPANILALGASVGVAAISISAGIGIIISALTLLATQGEGVATIINALGTAFSMVATTIIGAFAQAIVTVSSVLPIITSALSGLAPLVVAVGIAVGAMAPAIEAVGIAIGATAPAITALGTALSSVISALPSVISALGSAISQIVTAITPIIQILADAFLQLVPIVGNAISQIIQAITPIVPEITKMVEAIAPILSKIVEAFQTLIQEIKPIVDSITNLIKELGTQISNILTEAGNVINTFGDNVKKVFDGASNVVKSFGDTVKNILDGLAGIFDSIGNAALNAGKGIKQMAQGIKILVDLKLADLGATLAATATGLAAITASGIATAGPGLQQAGTGLMMIATAGQTATVALQMLPNILTVFSNSISNLPIKMNEVASSFASFASRAVMGLAGLSGANIHITTFRAQLMTIPPTLNMASASFNLFVSRAMTIGTTLMTIQTMITSFNAKVMTISATLNNVSNSFGLLTKVSDSVKNALGGVSSGLARVSSSANTTKNQISNMVAGSSAQIKSMASSTQIVVKSFNAMRAQIQTSMLSIVNILITSGNKMKNQGKIIGQQTAQNIAQGILSAIPMSSSAMISLMQAILTAGTSNINGMRNIGLMIGYGLAEGMYASLGEVKRAANALVEQADRAARAKAEIHSPSRLFRDNVGRYISQGIAVGIEKDAKNAYSAMDKLITGLMPNVTPEVALGTSEIGMASVGSQIVNNTTNQSQSYQPVFHFNIEKADLSSDKSIEETSEQLAILTERQTRGRLK